MRVAMWVVAAGTGALIGAVVLVGPVGATGAGSSGTATSTTSLGVAAAGFWHQPQDGPCPPRYEPGFCPR